MAVIKADWPHTAASDTGTARSTAMRQSVTICNPHPAAIHTFTGLAACREHPDRQVELLHGQLHNR